jgi:hypothetical protein
MCSFVKELCNGRVELGYLYNVIEVLLDLALAAESGLEREPFGFVQLVGLVILHLGQQVHSLLNLDVACRARANSAAIMLQIDIMCERYIEDAFPDERFARYPHG